MEVLGQPPTHPPSQLMSSQSHSRPLRATGAAFRFDGSLKSFPVSVWPSPFLSLAASLWTEEKRRENEVSSEASAQPQPTVAAETPLVVKT